MESLSPPYDDRPRRETVAPHPSREAISAPVIKAPVHK